MKKRVILLFCTLSVLLHMLSSCQKGKPFEMEYPEIYTANYCLENYVEADPNLVYLYAAKNEIGGSGVGIGKYYHFSGIKDIPLDKYLAAWGNEWMNQNKCFYVMQNKKTLDEQAVLDYSIEKIELFWHKNPWGDDEEEKWTLNIGEMVYFEHMYTFEKNEILDFQTYLRNAINTNSFKDASSISFKRISQHYTNDYGQTGDITVSMRVYFSEFENLVWDSEIYRLSDDGKLYFSMHYSMVDANTIEAWSPEERMYFWAKGYVLIPEYMSEILTQMITQ